MDSQIPNLDYQVSAMTKEVYDIIAAEGRKEKKKSGKEGGREGIV